MREVKFRFVYKGDFQIHYKHYYLSELFERSLRELSDCHFQMPLISKDQYTGLKDCLSKEAYENDRFKIIESGNKYVIVFQDGAYGYISKISGDFVPLHHLKNECLEWKIIGNIHEKELLK